MPFRAHLSLGVWHQFPSAYHGAVTLYHQPGGIRPSAGLVLVALDGLLVFPTHQPFGPLRLALDYLADAAAVQLHPIVFPKLPAGLGKGLFGSKVGQGPL